MNRSLLVRLSLTATAGAVLLTGCSGSGSAGDGAAGGDEGSIAVAASDDACAVDVAELPAGTHTFSVTNNGSQVTEFYIYADGDRVMGEVENIGPGLSRDLIVELAAGDYQTACKPGMIGDGIRNDLAVTGEAERLTEDELLAQATEDYSRYVQSQTVALTEKNDEFVAAVVAGDIPGAKSLFPIARTYWERIEPVAEIFGDLDPAIDGREGEQAEGEEFTGWHRLEFDLWVLGDVSQSGPIAEKLQVDVAEVVELANATDLSPIQLANGAKELLDEIATGKITGEEDRYSHTDLWDFAANLEGSEAAVQALRPALEERDPELVAALDTEFANATAALEVHRSGDGWQLHDQLTEDQLQVLSDAINALAEEVSQVAGVIAG
ncbi:MAG: iron uptake system protein EfeO [Geodermatophilaceae bacterium]